MRNILFLLPLLALPSCGLIDASFPTQSKKIVELSQKGIAQYCERVPLGERVGIRLRLNTSNQGAFVYCQPDELLLIEQEIAQAKP